MAHKTEFLVVGELVPCDAEEADPRYQPGHWKRHYWAAPRLSLHRPRQIGLIYQVLGDEFAERAELHNCPDCNPSAAPMVDNRRTA